MPECGSKSQQCQSSEQFLEFFQCNLNDFLSRLVTVDKTWLYHYDPQTKQQSMEWRHSTPPQKIPSAKICRKSSLSPWFFGIKTACSSFFIFQTAKLWTQSITHLCWCNWRSLRGSCSCTTMPRFPGRLQPRRNWPTLASNVLITHPMLRIWPCRTTTDKTIERSPFLSNMEVIAAVETWLDGQSSEFFWVACKSKGLRSVLSFVGNMLK